jgi:Fanconi anemia group J protein
MNVDLKGAAIIIDEAHNVEDVCRGAASLELTQRELEDACTAFGAMQFSEDAAVYTHLESVARSLSAWLRQSSAGLVLQSYGLSLRIGEGLEAVAVLKEAGVSTETLKELNAFLAKATKNNDDLEAAAGSEAPLPALPCAKALVVMKSLFSKAALLFEYPADYKLAVQQQTRWSETRGRDAQLELTFCLWCMSPAVAFRSAVAAARCVILTSGTLAPVDSFASELATEFHNTLQTGHVINTSRQVWVGTIRSGPGSKSLNGSYQYQDSAGYQDELGETVLQCCRAIPHGVLCFFPSYSFLDKAHARWKATGLLSRLNSVKTVVLEPRAGGDGVFDRAMTTYYNAVRRSKAAQTSGADDELTGALFLAVCRGKVSEGLDFADENARGVLVIGVPYPNAKDPQVMLKKAYNTSRSRESAMLNGDRWYSLQAFRAINQARSLRFYLLYLVSASICLLSRKH